MIIKGKNPLSVSLNGNPLFFMYGQSNGKGHEPLANLQAQYKQTYPSIKVFTGSSYESLNYLTNNNQWPEQQGWFGCEFSLMTRVQSYYGRNVYLSKPCYGGCGLAAGAGVNGDLTPSLTTSNYKPSAALWTRAMTEANSTSVKAFIFIGGESDAGAPYNAAFQANLELMYTNVKAVLNQPNLPIIIVGVTNNLSGGTGNATIVRAAMVSFVAAGSNRYFISSDTYGKDVDDLHYNAAGYEAMGVDIYNCMITNNLLN